jgi:hypothetical protein
LVALGPLAGSVVDETGETLGEVAGPA